MGLWLFILAVNSEEEFFWGERGFFRGEKEGGKSGVLIRNYRTEFLGEVFWMREGGFFGGDFFLRKGRIFF